MHTSADRIARPHPRRRSGRTVKISTVAHRRVQGLDLLRGAAIILVMLRHSWGEVFGGGGIVGVVVFFTLSGYLITGLLASDVRRYGRVRYGRFYRNRALRLIPALVFMLCGFVIMEGLLNVSGTRDQVVRSVLVALTYTQDIPGFNHGSGNLSHLWTLANEEQFYLVWPLIIFLGIRFRKLRLVVALSAAALFLALVASLIINRDDIGAVYSLPTTWTISMVIGAAAQLGQPRISQLLRGTRGTVAAVASAIGLVVLLFFPDAKDNLTSYVVGGSLIGLLTIPVLWKLKSQEVVPSVLRPLVWLGLISYAAYLWNYPIIWWLRDSGMTVGWEWAAIGLTIVAAAVSWFAVEKPLNRVKQRLDARAVARSLEAQTAATAADTTPAAAAASTSA